MQKRMSRSFTAGDGRHKRNSRVGLRWFCIAVSIAVIMSMLSGAPPARAGGDGRTGGGCSGGILTMTVSIVVVPNSTNATVFYWANTSHGSQDPFVNFSWENSSGSDGFDGAWLEIL
jgi:hypothetical protein